MNFPKSNRFFCLLLCLCTLIVYSNSFENAFQYDDYHVIVNNPYIKDPVGIPQFFVDPKMGSGLLKDSGSYRPLLMITFGLNYAMGGLNVFGYHLANFVLHVLCALLVYFLVLFFLQNTIMERGAGSIENQMAALLAALIFAVHPVQTESVTYITGRSSSLITFFFLASFLAYVHYGDNGRKAYLAFSAASYGAALLVKEAAVTLPVILFFYGWLFPRGRTWKRRILSMIPHLLLSAVYLGARVHFFGLKDSSTPIRPLKEQILTQLNAWVHNLQTLLFPLHLNVDYDFPIAHSILEGRVLLSILILSAVALVIWKISKAIRPVAFFAIWFAVTLAPTSSIVPLKDVVADRWLYLPSVGYAAILAMVADWLFRTAPMLA
ncbi:MAG: hypothetical protein NTY64_23550 [Deltaproteobacteria bacterium]|nr:hypothetical protein [Deltaproteobacteria bacterium]